MFFVVVKDVLSRLDMMSFDVFNLPGDDMYTFLTFVLPLEFENHASQLMDILKCGIFE